MIVPLTRPHYASLIAQDHSGRLEKWADEGYMEQAELSVEAFAAINMLGHCVAVGGILEYWKGRAEVWAMIQTTTPGEFLVVHKAAKKMCDKYWGRLECTVNYDFVEGQRWARMLGFKKETECMRDYFSYGSHATMWVKHGIRGGH